MHISVPLYGIKESKNDESEAMTRKCVVWKDDVDNICMHKGPKSRAHYNDIVMIGTNIW